MNPVSKPEKVTDDSGLSAMLDSLLESMRLANPDLAQAVLYCSIPRWFDSEVATGLCVEGDLCLSARNEIFSQLVSLKFCSLHPTRSKTWEFRKAFRDYFLTRPELTAHWQELHARAAGVFKRMLEAKGIHGDKRFQDEEWRLVAVEWLYHLLQVDQEEGLAALTTICAEALAIPVYQGPSWEINFCVRLLADLEWPADAESLNLAIGELKKGFGYLAAGQNAQALTMVKRLATVPELPPEKVGELHYFAGITHLYDEGKMGPALEELEKAAELMPNRAIIHAEIAAVHYQPGTIWGRLDLAEKSAKEAIRVEEKQAHGYVALGRIYEQQEDWEQAIQQYRKAIAVEPDDTDGYLALSEAYTARREATQAIGLIDKTWAIDPGREYYAAIRKGDVFANVRDFDQARREYERAVALGSDLPATYLALGGFHERIDEISEAAAMYNKAIKLDQTVGDGYVALAGLYNRQGKLQKAMDICQRCLASGVVGKGILIVLADLYDQQECFVELKEVQEKIVALDSIERYPSYCALGNAWITKARKHRSSPDRPTWLAQAQAEFKKAIELNDLSKYRAWAYLSLGEVHVLRGEYNQLDEIERLVAVHTPWAQYDLLVKLGQDCLRNNESKTCEMLLNRAVDLAPHRIAGWLVLADLYAWQGDPVGVARAWAQALKIDPALCYDAHIALGDAYKRMEDCVRARQEFTEAIKLEPNTGRGYLWLGVVAEAEGSQEEAVEAYQAAAEKASGLAPQALTNIARLQREQQKLLAAERTLRRAIDLDPDQIDVYLELARLGVLCDRQELITEAAEQIASTLSDHLYDLYNTLGDAYRSVGRFDDAQKAFDQCLELDPSRADAYMGLAQLFMDQEQWSDARNVAAKAIEIDPTAIGAYVILSRLCEADNDVDGVITAQRQIVEIAPTERYNACINIGSIYEKMGQLPLAEQQYRKALAFSPWRRDAYIYLGFLLTSEQPEEIEEIFEKAKAEANASYADLAIYLENRGKLTDALKIYGIGMRHSPTDVQVDLCLGLARLHHQLKETDKEVSAFQQVITLDPQRPEGYVGLMQLLIAQGRLDDAVQVCRQMAEQPKLAYNASMSLGYLMGEKKAYTDAEKAYRQAIELAPGVSDAYMQLGQLLVEQERPGDATQVYRQMAGQAELAYDAYFLLGDLWVTLEKYVEAEQAYRQGIKTDRQKPDGYLRLAQLYRQQGKLSKAEKLIQEAKQAAPDSADPYIVLAQLREQQDRVDDAIDLYRQIVQRKPSEAAAAYVRIGNLLIDKDRYAEAVTALQQAVQKDPANVGAYFSLGRIYEQQANLEQAVTMYAKVIDTDPKSFDAYVALGRIYGQQEKKDAIEPVIQQLMKLDLEPHEQYEAWLAAAELYKTTGKIKAAEASCERAIGLAPQRPEGYVRLMYLLVEQKRLDDAVQICHRMAEQPKLAYNAYVSLGNLLGEKQVYAEAEQAYRQAITLNPQIQDAYAQLGQMLLDQKRPDDAAQVYEQMAKQPGLTWLAHILLGDLWMGVAKHKEAAQAYRQAIKADRHQLATYLRLAQLYREQGELNKAEQSIQSALKVVPESPEPYMAFAQLREQQDRVDDAVALYRHIAQLKPSEASAVYERIGDLLIDKKRYDEALTSLQQAVQGKLASAGAYFSLGWIYEQQANLEQAAAMYAKAIEADPKYFNAYITLIRIYGQQKAIAKIANLTKQLLGQNLQPTELYDAHMAIGAAYQTSQVLEWATDEFRTALGLDPTRTDAYLTLGQIYEMQKRWADAREIYHKLDELVPAWQPDVHRKLGDLYWLEGTFAEAEQEYRKVITLAPERWEGYAALAQFYMTREEWYKAAEIWEHLTGLKDIDPSATCSAYLYLADVRRTLGDVTGMLLACSEVITLVDTIESPNSELLRLKGLAFFMQGKYDEACKSLMLCLEVDPGDIKAHFYLALTLLCQGKRSEADQEMKRGQAYIKEGSEFDSAIREAKVLAERIPEVAGAKEILKALMEAAGNGIHP